MEEGEGKENKKVMTDTARRTRKERCNDEATKRGKCTDRERERERERERARRGDMMRFKKRKGKEKERDEMIIEGEIMKKYQNKMKYE